MDTLRAAFHKITGRDEAGWTSWSPPQEAGETQVATPSDTVALDTTAPSAAPAVTPPWAELARLGLLTTAPAVPGPIGAVLSAETQNGLTDFLRRMDANGVRLALHRPSGPGQTARYKPLAPDEAMTWLASQPSTFSAPVAAWTPSDPPVALTSLADLMTLDALLGPNGAAQAPNPALGAALRSLTERCWRMSSEQAGWAASQSHSPLQAYLNLEAGKSVDIWTQDGHHALRAQCVDDLLATDYFDGAGIDRGLSHPQVAATLQALDGAGWRFRPTLEGHRGSQPSVRGAYLEIAEGRPVVLIPAAGEAAFLADASLLADLTQVKQRADEVEQLYREHARPHTTQLRDADDIAHFFGLVYSDRSGQSREKTCERLAAICESSSFNVSEVFNQVRATATADGDIDGLIADYTRIAKAGLADADRLPAFRYLHEIVPKLAGPADEDRAALRETFVSVLEHTHNRALAERAIEVSSLPLGAAPLAERAEVMRTVASAYRSEWGNELVADYMGLVAPPKGTPVERARHLAETLAPLQAAFSQRDFTKAARDAHEARALTLLPVGSETQAERTALMTSLIESHDGGEPLEVYPALLMQRLPDEGLVETGEIFRQVAAGLARTDQRERAVEVFRAVQGARREMPAEKRGEVMSRFNETIVLKGDVNAAITATTQLSRETARIVDDGRTVTIGGIRLQRNPDH